jgi:putative peptidoglycan lipid II flippase
MSDIIKSAKIVSICTLISRITGLIRDVLFARVFGTGAVCDAFLLAYAIPNLFRRLFGEGSLSPALVPAYSEYRVKGDSDGATRFLGATFTAVTVLLSVIVGVGVLGSLFLRQFVEFSQKWELTLKLFPIMLPYVVPICLVALVSAVLYCHGRFALPSLAPVVLNLFWIVGLLLTSKMFYGQWRMWHIAVSLSLVVLAAGFFQFLLQVPVIRAEKIRLPLRLDLKDPGLAAVKQQWFPVAFSAAVLQINVLSDRLIAMGLVRDPGGVSTLYYADRLLEFPLALIGIAAATAALPALSECIARQDTKTFAKTFVDVSRSILFVSVPAAVGLAVLRVPIIRLLFERGEFIAQSTHRTALTLLAYASSVWSYSLYHITTRAFYSLKDSKTPARVGVLMVCLNLALNIILVFPLAEAGIALATSITSIVNLVTLHILLRRRVSEVNIGGIWRAFVRFLALSGPMALFSYISYKAVEGKLGTALPAKLIEAALPIGLGVAVFLGMAALLKVPEVKTVFAGIGRKRGEVAKGR